MVDTDLETRTTERLRKEWNEERERRGVVEGNLVLADQKIQQLTQALVKAAIPLEALNSSARWELADDLKKSIREAVTEISKVIQIPRPEKVVRCEVCGDPVQVRIKNAYDRCNTCDPRRTDLEEKRGVIINGHERET